MATTEETKTGNGTSLTFTIPYIKPSDIKIKVDGGTPLEWDTSTSPSAGKYHIVDNTSTITFGTSYTSENSILIYRDTNVDSVAAVFSAGSSIRAKDLNAIHDMARFAIQEEKNDVKYTTAEQTKLSGIATGAEVNVQSDWNASSGDAQILNKPSVALTTGATFTDNVTIDSGGLSTAGLIATNTRIAIGHGNLIDTLSGNLTLDSAGGTVQVDDNLKFTGHLYADDGKHIILGTGNNLEIYHGSSGGSKFESDQIITIHSHNQSVLLKSGSNNNIEFDPDGSGKVLVTGPLETTGNITVGGTVDGVDIAALNTTVGTKFPLAGGTLDGNVRFNGSNASNYLFWDKSADSLTAVNGTITTTTLDVTGNITVGGTVDGIDIATDVAANTAKVTNATHTGEVTGSTALTITDDVVDEANLKISNTPSDGQYLQYKDSTDELTWATVSGGGSAGGANTIHMNDNVKITFGDTTTPDLEIYHENTNNNSVIKEQGSGLLKILTNGLEVKNVADDSYSAFFGTSGACQLYFGGNSSPKLETTENGAKVTGSSLELINTSNLGDAFLYIKGGESGASVIELQADEADEDNDLWRIQNAGDNKLSFRSKESGSWVEKLGIEDDGDATFAGKLGVGIAADTELHVKGTQTVARFEGTGGASYIDILDSDDSSRAYIGVDGGTFKIQTGSGFPDRLTINSSGNATFEGYVGIGATADSTKLFSVNETVAGNNIAQFVNPSSTGQGIYVAAGTSDSTKYALWIQNHDSSADAFKVLGDGTTTIAGNVTTGELLTVSGADPRLVFTDTDNTPDFTIWGKDGDFQITNTSLGGDVTQFSIDGATGNATFTGTVTAPSVASSANGMRKMTTSTSAPSGGSDGDVWFKYTA